MTGRYQRDGSLLVYECNQAHTQLAVKTCQTMRGERIDQAVVHCFLEAIEPARLEIALSTLAQLEARAKQIDQQARRQIGRAEVMKRIWLAVAPVPWTRTIGWSPGA